ncbi:MAG TPA: hypothetical protein VHX39_33425 [Acetobacteraceae bacterium]|nr:hypothetical protein [Acetobacteraceae bacterium]
MKTHPDIARHHPNSGVPGHVSPTFVDVSATTAPARQTVTSTPLVDGAAMPPGAPTPAPIALSAGVKSWARIGHLIQVPGSYL